MAAADQAGWALAVLSFAKHAFDYAKSRGRAGAAQVKAEAAQTAADADLQNAVNRAVKLALEVNEDQIKSLRAELAEARAELARYKQELDEARDRLEIWEVSGRTVTETLEKKRAEEQELRQQLLSLEAEKNKSAIELAKARQELDRARNELARLRDELRESGAER